MLGFTILAGRWLCLNHFPKITIMRNTLCLSILLFFVITITHGQEASMILRDSINSDRGVTGTLDFEPEIRINFPSYDEQGRVLEEVHRKIDAGGVWRPQSRRMFAYDNDELSQMHIQIWNPNTGEWRDQRKDQYYYEDGLLKEFIRQKALQGQLENERRWSYTYNEDEQETEVFLQEWKAGSWENLTRKIVDYNETDEIDRQTLQIWINNDWQNVRCRQWDYEEVGSRSRVKATTVKIWSVEKNAWVDLLRKLFFCSDGLWVRSRFENWDEETQEWINDDRMLYLYNGQNQPIGQYLQSWDGKWVNRGQVNYTFQNNQFLSRIETWDKAAGEWSNFLRYRVEYDEEGLLKAKTGMQA